MKYLEWNYKFDWLSEDDLPSFLEKCSKSKVPWWKNLKPFVGLFKNHMQYFAEKAMAYFSNIEIKQDEGIITTVKSCPAITDGILDKCFLVKAPCDIFIAIKDYKFYYEVPEASLLKVTSHSHEQFYTEKDNPFENKMNIKFELPLTIGIKKVPYIFLHPQYHKQDYPFEVLNGSLDGTIFDRHALNINTMIDINKAPKEMLIKKGTVLAYLWTAESLELKRNTKLKERYFTSLVSKRKY